MKREAIVEVKNYGKYKTWNMEFQNEKHFDRWFDSISRNGKVIGVVFKDGQKNWPKKNDNDSYIPNLVEKQRAIAVFMGCESQPDAVDERVKAYDVRPFVKVIGEWFNENEEGVFHPEDMAFHKDWNWLMPVIEELDHHDLELKEVNDALATRSIIDTFNVIIKLITCKN